MTLSAADIKQVQESLLRDYVLLSRERFKAYLGATLFLFAATGYASWIKTEAAIAEALSTAGAEGAIRRAEDAAKTCEDHRESTAGIVQELKDLQKSWVDRGLESRLKGIEGHAVFQKNFRGQYPVSVDSGGNINLRPFKDGASVYVRDGNTEKGIRLYGGGMNLIESVALDGASPFTLSLQPGGGSVEVGGYEVQTRH